jgi:hypothetical protein
MAFDHGPRRRPGGDRGDAPLLAARYRASEGLDPQLARALQDMYDASFGLHFFPLAVLLAAFAGAVAGGTRLTLTAEGHSGGFFGIVEPIFARLAARRLETELARLKDLLEAGA